MNDVKKVLADFLFTWFGALGHACRAASLFPIVDKSAVSDAEDQIDPDFEGWLHNDPMVTGNPASRYGDDAPGYVTGNGLGSLEIGAADD